MSKRRPEKRGPVADPRRPHGTLPFVVLVVAGLAAAAVYGFWPAPLPIPELDLESMEPQVAEKVAAHVAAVRESPDSGEAWGELGVVLHAHGLEEEASQCYRQAIERAPGTLRWEYLQVHALRSIDPDRALAQTERALRVGDDYPPLHIIRAELLEERGEVDGALAHFEKAFALDPESAMAAFGAGRLYLSRGELEKSLALLMRAAALAPEAGAIHASLAQVYRRMGDREKAMEQARLAVEQKSAVAINDPIHFRMRGESVSSIAQLARAQEAVKAGDLDRAERIYRRLVVLRPDDGDMWARLGDVLAQQEQIDPAKKAYLEVLERKPDHPGAHYGLGNMLSLEGHYEEALEHYEKARSGRPDHWQTLVNMGSVLAFLGRTEEAERALENALELAPNEFDPHRQLGALRLKQRRWDEAIEHLTRAVDIDPESGPVHLELAVALASVGRFEAALSHADRARELGQEVPAPFLARLKSASSGAPR